MWEMGFYWFLEDIINWMDRVVTSRRVLFLERCFICLLEIGGLSLYVAYVQDGFELVDDFGGHFFVEYID